MLSLTARGSTPLLPGRLESATSHASPLVKPGQTMQPAGALRLQPTLCPWMKRSGRLLSSDSQSLNRSSKWTRPSERVPMWRRSPGSSTGIQLQDLALSGFVSRRAAVPCKHPLGDRLERSCCNQHRRSIRFAKAGHRPESRQLRKQPRPLAEHSQPVRDTNKPVS